MNTISFKKCRMNSKNYLKILNNLINYTDILNLMKFWVNLINVDKRPTIPESAFERINKRNNWRNRRGILEYFE